MQKKLILGDTHIDKSCFNELENVFTEVLKNRKGCGAIICLGDYYDKKNPTASEIEFGTKWATIFKKEFGRFVMIEGNHPAIDDTSSSVKYLQHCGVELYDDTMFDSVYYGHYMVQESLCGFGETKKAIDLVTLYPLSVLGHQHSFQEINLPDEVGSIVHLGSCRYVDFGEANDKEKVMAIEENGQLTVLPINTLRPMRVVDNASECEHLPPHYQVCLDIKSFAQLKREASQIEMYKNKFYKFKVKFSFVKQQATLVIADNPSVKVEVGDIVSKWLGTVADEEVKAELLNQMKAEGVICS
jgi:DNA repair exonuclease SbcCD nuclease subunit